MTPKTEKEAGKTRIGLALGSGSARGWAHIGVIRALEQAGIHPDIVCGTSVGAFVGAAYVDGDLARLEEWVRSLTVQAVVGFLDVSLNGGLIKGERLIEFFRRHFVDKQIAELPLAFAAVATDLQTGREVWLQEGSVIDAVRASIALPGLFTPARREGRWLVDGGLVNPVPVSLCRAMGADCVIAVDLNAGLVGRHLKRKPGKLPRKRKAEPATTLTDTVVARLQAGMSQLGINPRSAEDKPPAMLDVLATSINIMQVLITRSRLAGDPPDVMISPQLAELGLMEFHRAALAIETGQRAAERALPQLMALVNQSGEA
jgi:NTE family protein